MPRGRPIVDQDRIKYARRLQKWRKEGGCEQSEVVGFVRLANRQERTCRQDDIAQRAMLDDQYTLIGD